MDSTPDGGQTFTVGTRQYTARRAKASLTVRSAGNNRYTAKIVVTPTSDRAVKRFTKDVIGVTSQRIELMRDTIDKGPVYVLYDVRGTAVGLRCIRAKIYFMF